MGDATRFGQTATMPSVRQRAQNAFWREPVALSTCKRMSDKYAALMGLGSDPGREQLRRVAASWPGALREVELVSPDEIAQRRAASEAALSKPARARQIWREAGDGGIVLWAALHEGLRALLALRRRHAAERGPGLSYAMFVDRVGDLEGWPHAQWPPASEMRSSLADPSTGQASFARARSVYLGLAWRSGLTLAELNRELFARAGHWDTRPDDPPWSRAAANG